MQAVVTKKGTAKGTQAKPAQKKTLRERAGWWSDEKNAAKLSQWYGPERSQFLGKLGAQGYRHFLLMQISGETPFTMPRAKESLFH